MSSSTRTRRRRAFELPRRTPVESSVRVQGARGKACRARAQSNGVRKLANVSTSGPMISNGAIYHFEQAHVSWAQTRTTSARRAGTKSDPRPALERLIFQLHQPRASNISLKLRVESKLGPSSGLSWESRASEQNQPPATFIRFVC